MAVTSEVVSVGDLNVKTTPGYIAQLNMVGDQLGGVRSVYNLKVTVRDEVAGSSDALLRALLRQVDAKRGPLTITIRNTEGNVRNRFMQFVIRAVSAFTERDGRGVSVNLESIIDPHWRSVDIFEETFELTSTSIETIVYEGDLDAFPVYTIEATDDRDTPVWPYRRTVLVRWRSPFGGYHAIDVTGGGLNTAALLTADKVNDDSNLAVMMNGPIVRHWYADTDPDAVDAFGKTATRVWINMEFDPAVSGRLKSALASSGTFISVADESVFPVSGVIGIDNEIISYYGRSKNRLNNVHRGRYGTTATTHAKGAEVFMYCGVGHILYGPSGAVAEHMQTDRYIQDEPPVFLANGNSNTHWRYDVFANGNERGRWRYSYKLGDVSYVKESDSSGLYDTDQSYPWLALGLTSGWTRYAMFYNRFSVPLSYVTVFGRYIARGSETKMPSTPRLRVISEDGESKIDVLTIGSGQVGITSEEFEETRSEIDAEGLYNKVVWSLEQGSYAQADISALEVGFPDEYQPIVVLGSEETSYDLDLNIANGLTGESIRVSLPIMDLNKELVIDSDAQTVVYDGISQYFTAVVRDATRQRFLRLAPGSNPIQFAETGMGSLTITVRYRARYYA